jgi:hypothetical protein
VLWQKFYIACVLETNSEKLKALIHETENAIISRLQTLETPDGEHREIARALASLLVLKSERLSWPQSCAEYEQLFDKCLDALTRWTRLHGLTIVLAQWEHRRIAKCGVRSATMRPRSRHCTNTRAAGAWSVKTGCGFM